MRQYREIEGDLIRLAVWGEFDVISHGCNCYCHMGAGIAPQMARAFGADMFPKEKKKFKADINKLGQIDYRKLPLAGDKSLIVVNSYTQFGHGKNHEDGVSKPLDYIALIMCMKKINHLFKGKKIGLPMIGCGLAGGDWNRVKFIIKKELKDCDVTVVIYKG